MNRSYSKIRHIQKTNVILENRNIRKKNLINEEDDQKGNLGIIADCLGLKSGFVGDAPHLFEFSEMLDGIVKSTNYLDCAPLSNWDEEGLVAALKSGQPGRDFDFVQKTLKCFLKTSGGPYETALMYNPILAICRQAFTNRLTGQTDFGDSDNLIAAQKELTRLGIKEYINKDAEPPARKIGTPNGVTR